MTHPKQPAVGSETPLTDAHLVHLNTFDGRKIGIPDSTLDLCRTLELALRRRDALLREIDAVLGRELMDSRLVAELGHDAASSLRERIRNELEPK